jgi:ABC-type multidrug transport system ATPase subunit
LGDRGQIHLWAEGVEYAGDKGKAGIRKFYASELTGQLIGIVGREGVGKSTLLKLLAGKIKPSSGSICINGYDLWRYKYMLKGIIGFVPEDDMLFEELTVSENLSLTARLFFNNLNSREIEMKVNAVLSKLDLLEAKHIVVGTTSGKQLQPGQRRLINIALEILREPQILLVDNALSGLGMSDAARVIRILHDYSFSGNLVITTISEVDNITFKLFDKLWVMDEGGRMVASGTAKEVSACLLERLNIKEQGWLATESSQLNDYLNYRMPETKGQVWTRVVSSEEWHDQYLKQQTTEKRERSMNMPLPARILKTPPLEIQLLIFSIRNFKCKFSNLYPIITTLLTGPLSALFLAFLMRPTSSSYSLFHNVNLPYYQFISVVISIFLGLVVSADEFIKERRIFEKEEYLELSRFSYLNSKILYLFPILGLQTLMYVITGNLVMGIREFVLAYWLVLFSASCFGILLGLLLSAHIMRRERTYKLILPLVIALQLLLGGGILKYEHLNTGIGQHVPVLGDLMVAKWGFEALAVKQFRDNKYERLFYKSQQREAVAAFHSLHTVPRLERALSVCKGSINNTDSMDYFCRMLQKELKSLTSTTDVFPFEYIQKLHKSDVINVNSDSPVSMSAEHRKLLQETEDYLMYLQLYFTSLAEEMKEQGISHLAHVRDSIGANQLELLKRNYHNAALEQLVTEKMAIYRAPESNLGRTNFFCATKLFNGQRADTFWFNISVIWSFSSVCYLLILFNVFGKRFYL